MGKDDELSESSQRPEPEISGPFFRLPPVLCSGGQKMTRVRAALVASWRPEMPLSLLCPGAPGVTWTEQTGDGKQNVS